jgi:LacI family repressor for deo operon, udp, cdd, tsx, nupC, and nupG
MKAVTLKDVALAAGVSARTVSNVVNGYVHVAEETRHRVQDACDRLGYRPNLLARNLRSGRSGVIALVVPEIGSPYFGELGQSIIEEARGRGYVVLIDHTGGDVEQEKDFLVRSSASNLFDGVILSPSRVTGDELRRILGVPFVLLGPRLFDPEFDHVSIDNVAAAAEVTTHLLKQGRHRVAAIGEQRWGGSAAQVRTQGFRQAHEALGLRIDEELIVPTARFQREDGAAAMRQLIESGRKLDAVFCFNDLLALGAMRAIHQHGLRVPEDIAVVGFDNIEEGKYATPSLTTIAPDRRVIARLAVERLLARINGEPLDEPARLVVPHELLVRESA